MPTTNKSADDATRLPRVAFDLSPAMKDEVDRILQCTDLGSPPEVFRRAFTLLRIHLDAAHRGREIYMVDPNRPNEKLLIVLPFNVSKEQHADKEQ